MRLNSADNFSGSSARKGDNLDLISRHTLIDQMRCTRDDGFGFAAACTSQHQSIGGCGGRRLALIVIEFLKQCVYGHIDTDG